MLKGFRIATTVARYQLLLRNPRSRALLPTINRQLASPYGTSSACQSVHHKTTSKPPRSGQRLTWVIDSKYDTFQRNEEADMFLSKLVNQHYDLKIGDNVMDAEKDQHYEIVRKLGRGDKATTWLARHILSDSSKGDYVALKVMTAYATACSLQTGKYVIHPISLIRESNSKHSGARHCASIKHPFLAQAPTEQHLCFVMDPLGSTLDELARVQPNGSFPPRVVKNIVKQLILALDYLHCEGGVIHGLQSFDIGISIPTDNNGIAEFLRASPAENDPIRHQASVAMDPFSTVKSQPLPNFGLEPDLSNLSVRLMDYGLDIDTVKARTYGSDMIVFPASSIRAPEIMLRGTLTPAIDIWSIGNLTYLYATGRPLFSEHITQIGPDGRWKDPAVNSLAQLTELLGPFPFLFLEKCALRDRYFEADGELLQPSEGQRSLEDDVRRYSDLEERDAKALTSFIRRCLTLEPSERATLHELQSHEWLR